MRSDFFQHYRHTFRILKNFCPAIWELFLWTRYFWCQKLLNSSAIFAISYFLLRKRIIFFNSVQVISIEIDANQGNIIHKLNLKSDDRLFVQLEIYGIYDINCSTDVLWHYQCPKGQLISKGLFGNERKNLTLLLWNLRSICFCSFFGRNWRHQKDISKLTDL